MRSIAFSTLLGGIVACIGLTGQSLTEHAAAAAGATIGTAAGKPIGTSLGKIFGDVDKNASAAATAKNAKPSPVAPSSLAKPEAAPSTESAHAAAPVAFSGGGGGDAPLGGGGGSSAPSHRPTHRREPAAEWSAPVTVAPAMPLIPEVAEPVIRQITPEDIAKIQVGASGSEMRVTLGPPESTVSIPGDDGHLLEICQYWANGAPVGTVRLDNGRVVSVKTSN